MAKKILVVDDEENIRELIGRVLSSEGYEVFKAHNGKEALKKVYDVSPDLMVLDIMMPVMDGFKVCEKIRKDPLYKNLPILMLTVKNEKEDMMHGFNTGVDEYMVKPYDVREIAARIKVVLDRS